MSVGGRVRCVLGGNTFLVHGEGGRGGGLANWLGCSRGLGAVLRGSVATRSTNYSTLITRPPKAFDIACRCLPIKRKECSDSSSRFLFTQAVGTFSEDLIRTGRPAIPFYKKLMTWFVLVFCVDCFHTGNRSWRKPPLFELPYLDST